MHITQRLLTAGLAVASLPLAAAPAHAAAPTGVTAAATARPSMQVSLAQSFRGRTLTYRYSDAGMQYRYRSHEGTYVSRESAGFRIYFGDGRQDGGDGRGGSVCTRTGKVYPFKDLTPRLTHRYAKPGRYRIAVVGYYCGGSSNINSVTRYYWIRVR